MAKFAFPKRTTEQIIRIKIRDSSSTTGAGLTGLVFNSASLIANYIRLGDATVTDITLVTATVGTWTSGGFIEVDATKKPGVYELGVPNAAMAEGSDQVEIDVLGATNVVESSTEIQLTEERAGKVNDASATNTSFVTDLTETANEFWSDQTLQFIDGALEGEAHRIDTYNGTTKKVTFQAELSAAPANGVKFRILPPSGPSRVDIANTILSLPLSTFNTPGTTGNELRRLGRAFPIEGKVDDASPISSAFITDLASAVDDFYNGQKIVFFDGPLIGQVSTIVDYTGATKKITVDPFFTAAPADTNGFALLPVRATIASGADVATAVWARILEGSFTMEQAFRLLVAASAGETDKMETGTAEIKALSNNLKTRVKMDTDVNGNRVNPTYDVTP